MVSGFWFLVSGIWYLVKNDISLLLYYRSIFLDYMAMVNLVESNYNEHFHLK